MKIFTITGKNMKSKIAGYVIWGIFFLAAVFIAKDFFNAETVSTDESSTKKI
ncbi:hypothetical protein QFZ72_004393 [Bacillus sp. V2I10]|nr:hypothetical protein [Bacillus sp. V2I10]